MTRAALTWLTLALVAGWSGLGEVSVLAQSTNPVPPPPTPVRSQGTLPNESRLTPFAVASAVFDSNIDHNTEDLDAYGMVLGVGAIAKNDPVRPTFELQYQVGFHRYTSATRWNRLSHYVRASWDRRLHRRVAFEAVGEGSLKGSTEDQELSNQATFEPRLEYRFTPALRVRGFAALRIRRYEDNPDRNAFNRYAGLELLGRPPAGPRWAIGGRSEENAAESSRQSYYRWTWYAELSAPIGARDRLELQGRYRRRRYQSRFVDVEGGPDVLRRDVYVEPEASWVHQVDRDLEIRAGYAFSGRDSNDPRREYRSHQVLLSVLQRW